MATTSHTSPEMIANDLQINAPIHPGEIIKDEMVYLGISQKKLSDITGISYTVINEIVHCKRQVSIEYAMLFEAALSLNSEMLVNMQTRYNKETLLKDKKFLSHLREVQKLVATIAL